jgi:RHS repeat-associated protein
VRQGIDSSFHLFDALGNTRYLLNHNGVQTDAYSYNAFGQQLNSIGSSHNVYGFRGIFGYYRDSSEHLYIRARYYDVLRSTWFSRDPIGFGGGDWNLYRYVLNNPVNYIDPTGLSCWCCAVVGFDAFCCDPQCDGNVRHPHRKTGPDTGFPITNLSTIVCDGKGGIRVEVGYISRSELVVKCLINCVKEHEKSHIRDALAMSPNVCKGKLDGTQVLPPNRLVKNQGEKRAYTTEVNCLKQCKPPQECVEVVARRISQIEKMINTGQYR